MPLAEDVLIHHPGGHRVRHQIFQYLTRLISVLAAKRSCGRPAIR